MSDTVVRPTFYEGEILPAADLVATVDSSRAQLARHERYVHRWGIAFGLKLTGTSKTDAQNKKYVSIVLSAGMAIDGTGREVVVSADTPLNPSDFALAVSSTKDSSTWYPVFLSGRDESAVGTSMLTGACSSSLPTQIKENYDISYGTPGSELSLDAQPVPDLLGGPSDGASSPWLILLGFVQWDSSISGGQFVAVQDCSPDTNVCRRYVGVNAAAVVAGGGTLQLGTHPAGSPDTKTVMALELHESNDGEMIFGKQNPDGSISKVFTVDSKGDLTIMGKFSSLIPPGSVQVQSGIASDGVIIPLPPGVTSTTKADFHIHIAPHLPVPGTPTDYKPPTTTDTWFRVPLECTLDDLGRVLCRIRWVKVPAAGPADIVDAPALCDYTIIAAVGG